MTLARVAELAEDYRTMQTYIRRAIDLRVIEQSSTRDRKKSHDTPKNPTLQNEDEPSEVRYLFSFILFSILKSSSDLKSSP
jgi:hypothetical protein